MSENPLLPGCRLRPLEEADAMTLAQALVEIDPWRSLGYRAGRLAAYFLRDDAALARWVVDREPGRVVGMLALRSPWLRGPYIELLAVLPNAQGGGIGGALVEWAAAQAAPSANLWACVSAFNAPARAFYARHGFSETATLADLTAEGVDEILLRKRLSSE